jgi:hypothetical protein
MLFTKQDMSFVHYRWDTEEQPASSIYNGEPARRPFDPFNGDQVLFLINYFGTVNGGLTIRQGRFLENRIAYQLPIGTQSERSVFSWLMTLSMDDVALQDE